VKGLGIALKGKVHEPEGSLTGGETLFVEEVDDGGHGGCGHGDTSLTDQSVVGVDCGRY